MLDICALNVQKILVITKVYELSNTYYIVNIW